MDTTNFQILLSLHPEEKIISQCKYKNCIKQADFAIHGKVQFCAEHSTSNMTYISQNKICQYADCHKIAKFGYFKNHIFCKDHCFLCNLIYLEKE